MEFEVDPDVTEKLRGCRISCAAVITGLADLPALEVGGRVLEVALLRMTRAPARGRRGMLRPPAHPGRDQGRGRARGPE